MKKDQKTLTFEAGVFQYTKSVGYHPLMTQDERTKVRLHETLYAIMPLSKVDPAGVYAFVINQKGETITVLKANIKFRSLRPLKVSVPQLSTYAQERHAKLNKIVEHIESVRSAEQLFIQATV